MSVTYCWEPVQPRTTNPISEWLTKALIKLFAEAPLKLGSSHVPYLKGMAAITSSRALLEIQELIAAIEEHGTIHVAAEF